LFKNFVASGGNFINDIADDMNEFVDYLLSTWYISLQT